MSKAFGYNGRLTAFIVGPAVAVVSCYFPPIVIVILGARNPETVLLAIKLHTYYFCY